MKKIKLIKFFVLPLFVIAGCKKSENTTTGNPFVHLAMTSSAQNATVAYRPSRLMDIFLPPVFALPPPPTLLDSAGNTIVINSSWVNIGQIEFKMDETASGSETDGDSVEFSDIYAINLLSNTPSSFASGAINVSAMRRIKIKLVRVQNLPADAPADFMGKSIYIEGTVNGHVFSYSTQDESVIEIAGPSLIAALENRTLLVELHIANLIKKTNLSAITATTHISDGNRVSATDPCPAIKNGSSDLFTCFYEGFTTESNLGRDDDGDFQLDVGEDAVKN